ncbi:MAG: chorismate-binding protein [Bacteroidetes bacterium]|nr:chorismate-binding protein [Bacteroidota bacterium]
MAEAIAIYRLPSQEMVSGLRGQARSGYASGLQAECFYLQPWDSVSEPLFISGESCSNPAELREWVTRIRQSPFPGAQCMDHGEFKQFVGMAVDCISQGEFQKVVTSRCKTEPGSTRLWESFEETCRRYPAAFVSLVHIPGIITWIGATPEVLLKGGNGSWSTMALAGTLRTPDQNWTEKERSEQAIITQFLNETLIASGATGISISARETIQAGPVAHLLNLIEFRSEATWHELTAKLHPTPAVSGYPIAAACNWIGNHEKLDRSFFSGWLGPVRGDRADIFVNLRCAAIYSDARVYYAGCGINAQSDAESEWLETEAKMQVIGSCLR